MSQIADILVEAGHNVTVLVHEMDPTINHPGSYKGKIIRIPSMKEIEDHFNNTIDNEFFWTMKNTANEQFKVVEKVILAFDYLTHHIFNDNELAEVIRKEKFDVGITEALNPFFLGMLKVWNVRTILSGLSMPLFDKQYKDFGLAFPSSHLPTMMSPFSDKMTYTEKCGNLFTFLLGQYISYFLEYKPTLQKEFDEKYGVGFYDRYKILGDVSFIFLNSNPFIDYPGPKTAKMIEVSGIGIKDIKPLDDYWNKILSLRTKTILISFGTVAKSSFMPENLKNGLLETIRRLKGITFIWKYETPKDGTGEGIDNLILSKWLPQSDLLNDKRLSAFITHGGLGSVTEAFFRGVPVIGIPILGDQLRNVKLFERHKVGLIMNRDDLLVPGILEHKIKTIIDNDDFRNNAKIASERLNNRPISSKELLIKHVEFAARFGKMDILDLASRDMGFIEYYNLDIIIPIITIFLSLVISIFYGLYKFFKRFSKEKMD